MFRPATEDVVLYGVCMQMSVLFFVVLSVLFVTVCIPQKGIDKKGNFFYVCQLAGLVWFWFTASQNGAGSRNAMLNV
jgi:hypothetical protein